MEYRKVQYAEDGSATANRKRLSHRTVFTSSCWVLLTAVLIVTPPSRAFTLDTTSPTVLSPDTSTGASKFGYTVAYWHGSDQTQWLLVGAPDWKKKKQEGALFRCNLNVSPPWCQTLPVDRGEKTCLEERCEDVASSQRLGATLAVHEDIALVCAPNWSYKITNKYGRTTGTPVGKCFFSENNALTNFTSFSAVYDMKMSNENIYFYTTGFCQSGFSALLLPEKQKVALGSPGCYTWTGDVLVGKPHSASYTNKGNTSSVIEDFSGSSPRKDVQPYDRYLGYSIAKGTFNNKLAVVAGSPKESKYPYMKAIINSSISVMERLDDTNLKIWKQLYPPHDKGWYFSYCGYSLAVGDLNGDGLDDIAVGCPNYDDDKGAVLVYYQIKSADGTFEMELEKGSEYRTGSVRGARFGSSVTVLGDIDGDGYKDLAVGSPYTSEGKNSSGRLYIYCSTKGQDLPKIACQEVAAPDADVSGGSVRNFGWSAAAHGPSVAVSAPASDKVLVFRTHPVVQLNVTVEALDKLDVSRPCSVKSGEDAPCVNITVCLQYTIRNGPQDSRKRKMIVDVELEPTKALTFGITDKSATENFNSVAGRTSCNELLVYDRKKSEEIVEYEITAKGSFTPAEDDPVVLDRRQGLESSAILRMKVDCAGSTYDDCQPDLRVDIEQDGDFVLGIQDSVKIIITVDARGDPAYYPKLLLSSDGFMAFSGDFDIEGALGQCTEDSASYDITCPLGGVLQETKATVTLRLSGSKKFYAQLRTGKDFFTVKATASCSSPIKEPSHGTETQRVDISVKPDQLQLSRTSDPVELDLSTWELSSTLETRGPLMVHSYEVDNPNKYDLYDVSLIIYWPQKHKEGYMLYTSEAPSFQRGDGVIGHCEAVAGGGFDEEQLYNSNATDTGISKTPSTITGEELGSADIQPLTIKCNLGNISPEGSIVVEVESYAFYQTFKKLRDSKVSPIKSMGVVTPGSAPLGKAFTAETIETITTIVIYPEAPFPWLWVVLGLVLGMVAIIIMGILFKKYYIDRKKTKQGTAGGVDEMEGAEGEELFSGDEEERNQDSHGVEEELPAREEDMEMSMM